jgi:hypothetical protein
MYAPITRYLSETSIERKRLLPGPAKILVRRGQEVMAIDPVVEELIYPDHQLLDAARGLGVPPNRADQLMHCTAGVIVAKGDVLAGPVGLTRRVMRAPQPGKIVSTGQGMILMELAGQPDRLAAGLAGEVVDLISERGVVIRGSGALIQGVWGNGKIGQGELHLIMDIPDQELTASCLTDQMAGSILVSGYCRDQSVLSAASQLSLRGIILASLHPALVTQAARANFPFLLVEGFGKHPINPIAREILTSNAGQPATLNSELGDVLTGARPELIIPKLISQAGVKPVLVDLFAPGRKVRLIGLSQLGQLGDIIDLIADYKLPNGLTAAAARVRLEDGTLVNFPLANLEILV